MELTVEELLLQCVKPVLDEFSGDPDKEYIFEGVSMKRSDILTHITNFTPTGKKFVSQWITSHQENFNFLQQQYLKFKFIWDSTPVLPGTSNM